MFHGDHLTIGGDIYGMDDAVEAVRGAEMLDSDDEWMVGSRTLVSVLASHGAVIIDVPHRG